MRTLATSALAALAVITMALAPTAAAPNCLTQPNLKAGDGRHWYYRTDRATKRKCWFVKGGSESFGQATREPAAAKPIPAPAPAREKPVQAIWDNLFPENPLYDPPSRFTDTERPLDTAPTPVRDRTADQTGSGEPPPIAAAYTADEQPAEPAAERQTIALLALAVLLVTLAGGAAVKQWRTGRASRDRTADYIVVLSRAIADVEPHDDETRRTIYACARRVLVDRLRVADPPVGDAVIASEEAALDAAIAQLESQSTHRFKRTPAPVREPVERSFTPRFGSGGTRPSARRRLGKIATWALGASRPA